MKSQLKTKSKVRFQTDECGGCKLDIWRCTGCHINFKKQDKVFCIATGEEHLCIHCFELWKLNGSQVFNE